MRTQVLLLASLALLGKSTVALPNPDICPRQDGVYDVCDTNYSYIRCNGHETLLVADCRTGPATYCLIVNDRGYCNGTTAPDLGGGTTPSETCSSAVASASTEYSVKSA